MIVLELYFLPPVLGGHHVLSGHLAIPQGWLLNIVSISSWQIHGLLTLKILLMHNQMEQMEATCYFNFKPIHWMLILFRLVHIQSRAPNRTGYTLLDGLAYNTRGYFASCVVFFRAPQGRGKMRAMSKMSASIIC